MATVIIGLGAMLLVYSVIIKFVAKRSIFSTFSKFRNPQTLAFSTASSMATMPMTLKTAEEDLKLDKRVSKFVIPLGTTINMDGTAIMQGVATVFIAQMFGIDLGFIEYLLVIITATLASIGTAGIPSVGLITLGLVLNQVGLPMEGVALILGIDRLLDMSRTAINVTGDIIVTKLIAKFN